MAAADRQLLPFIRSWWRVASSWRLSTGPSPTEQSCNASQDQISCLGQVPPGDPATSVPWTALLPACGEQACPCGAAGGAGMRADLMGPSLTPGSLAKV